MRRARIHRESKKVDVVITSARYAGAGDRLLQARGFERHGDVWSDTELYDRESLALRLSQGKRVRIGRQTDLPGDFIVGRRLGLADGEWIVVEGSTGGRDDLGVPLY